MNKWISYAMFGLISVNAYSEKALCGYKDFFRLSDSSHPSIYVVSGFSDPDLNLQIIGPRSFVIKDSVSCRRGYAHVTVAYDLANWCVLDIKDGPFMNHPRINASCNGIKYVNTQYDGLGSHSYTINLD